MTAIQFETASKAQATLKAALFGPAGSGKTFSALRIATGIARALAPSGGRIGVVDTERGSASKYADRFAFKTCRLQDRTVEGYVAAFEGAAEAACDILVIDSLSHGWQELLQEVDRLARAKYRGNSWSAWSEGTPKQRRMVDALLDFPGHVIATMRTKTAWEVASDAKGKVRPVRVGLAPEQGKGIEYEFDVLLELSPNHIATVIKDRTGRYQDAVIEKPDEAFGQALAQWLQDGTPPPPPPAEAAPETPEEPQRPDLVRLEALIAEHGLTEEQQARWCRHFKVDRLEQLAPAQVDAICAKIERVATEKGA